MLDKLVDNWVKSLWFYGGIELVNGLNMVKRLNMNQLTHGTTESKGNL